jgi:hypothetical protein
MDDLLELTDGFHSSVSFLYGSSQGSFRMTVVHREATQICLPFDIVN